MGKKALRVLLAILAVLLVFLAAAWLRASSARKAVLAAVEAARAERSAKPAPAGKDISSILAMAIKTAAPSDAKWKPLFEPRASEDAASPLVDEFASFVLPLLVQAGSIGTCRKGAITFDGAGGALAYADLKALERLAVAFARKAPPEARSAVARALVALGGAFETAAEPCVLRLRLDYLRAGIELADPGDSELAGLARDSFRSSLAALPSAAERMSCDYAEEDLRLIEQGAISGLAAWLTYMRLDAELEAARRAARRMQAWFEGKADSLEDIFEVENGELLGLFIKAFETGQLLAARFRDKA